MRGRFNYHGLREARNVACGRKNVKILPEYDSSPLSPIFDNFLPRIDRLLLLPELLPHVQERQGLLGAGLDLRNKTDYDAFLRVTWFSYHADRLMKSSVVLSKFDVVFMRGWLRSFSRYSRSLCSSPSSFFSARWAKISRFRWSFCLADLEACLSPHSSWPLCRVLAVRFACGRCRTSLCNFCAFCNPQSANCGVTLIIRAEIARDIVSTRRKENMYARACTREMRPVPTGLRVLALWP